MRILLRRTAVVSLLALEVGTPVAFARQDRIPGSNYTAARAQSLGEAYLPLADDTAGALFYNPALLAGNKRWVKVEPVNFSGRVNNDFISTVNIKSLQAYNLAQYAATTESNPTSRPGFGGAITPNVAFKYFAFGLLTQAEMQAWKGDTGTNYKSLYEITPALGLGIPLASGIVKIGYTFQWVNRTFGEVSNATGALSYSDGVKEGSGFSHNAGFQLTFPVRALPTFSVVGRNIGGLRYTRPSLLPLAKNSAGLPDTQPMSIDVAVSIQPKIGSSSYWNWVIQYSDVTNSSSTSPLVRLSTGLELAIKGIFFFRTGVRNGAPSLGFGFRRPKGEFAFSWYSTTTGDKFLQGNERQWMLQYQIRVF